MRFLDPDAGEMLDRLSVLARKRLEKPERDHFLKEEEALIKHWEPRVISGTLLAQVLRLAAVNMAIWQTEDDIREMRNCSKDRDGKPLAEDEGWEIFPEPNKRLADLAVKLQTMNEERARLVQFFNEKLGYGAVEEKDFAL